MAENTYLNAPMLGLENTVEIALVDTAVAPATTGVPAITGSYISLGCTQNIRIKYTSQPGIPIPCGIEPAKWVIPGRKEQGECSIEDLDFSDFTTNLQSFSGVRCVARISSKRDGTLLRTTYLSEWIPTIEVNMPEGDDPSTVSADGLYARITVVVPGP
jgi:hypothetical protein